jgi:predicted nucleotidyltransferase
MDVERTATQVANALAAELQDRLHSAVLYGSAARGEFIDALSDINLLILVDRIDTNLLQRLAPLAREWPKLHVQPMLLEEREWARAADAFAVELLDMKDARRVLVGRDPVADAAVDTTALRLQAERELRGRIIGLHNGMVRWADDPAALGSLLVAALPSFTTYLRAALRLAGRDAPRDSRTAIEAGTRLVDAPADGFLRALEARHAGGWKVALDDPAVASYAAAAERTAWYVDSWEEHRA